ncbi:MAG: glycosyltransferase family 2 protein, partial [Ignavibacteriales bacterium]|nr:glycosyltransferase family 2 protein [Ignavibacteriales bacterium]
IEQCYNVKYNPDAIAYEKTSESIALEFKRKVRISAANFHCISEFAHLLHPRYGFASFALWSHKMLRWFVPFFLLSAIASSAILAIDSEFFWLVFIGEVSFLALATGGFVSEKSKLHIGVLGLPYYFLAMNTALLVGFIRFLLKRQKPAWDILRHTEA